MYSSSRLSASVSPPLNGVVGALANPLSCDNDTKTRIHKNFRENTGPNWYAATNNTTRLLQSRACLLGRASRGVGFRVWGPQGDVPHLPSWYGGCLLLCPFGARGGPRQGGRAVRCRGGWVADLVHELGERLLSDTCKAANVRAVGRCVTRHGGQGVCCRCEWAADKLGERLLPHTCRAAHGRGQ